jgi:hypothetical protein
MFRVVVVPAVGGRTNHASKKNSRSTLVKQDISQNLH